MGRLFQKVSSSAECRVQRLFAASQTVCVCVKDQIKIIHNNSNKGSGVTASGEAGIHPSFGDKQPL